ncbi:MAG: glutamate racemase [Muribaculaceae bacterium]|nr:glutamate racemase [Muribaculaceae bacterium]
METKEIKVSGPIGVFDSGYGGLTVLREIARRLPGYDYLYLGDNARAPYGTRSFDIVYRFTLEAVKYLFDCGCHLVVLACNTASAKALRTIQQVDLPRLAPDRRVLGVIRPTVEVLPALTRTGHIGVFGTPGTIASQSYDMEIAKLHPTLSCRGQACPMWVPLVENGEADGEGADYFVKKYVDRLMCDDEMIDTVILGCTHYPLLASKIQKYLPAGVRAVSQGEIVAGSLADYLARHPEIECRCSAGGEIKYVTTEDAAKFDGLASMFMGKEIKSTQIVL